jgi:DNA primase
MPKNKLVDFRAIRQSVSMDDILRHYGILDRMKRSGDSLSGCCPIHKGSNPTQFRVSLSKNLWNCFSECKHGGNVLDFIVKMEDVTVHGAAIKAIEWFKLDPDRVRVDATSSDGNDEAGSGELRQKPVSKPEVPAEQKVETNLPNPPLKFRLEKLRRDHPYLQERGLNLETLVDFGVGFCSKGMMAGRIAVPIHNLDGQVVAYAGRYAGDPPDGTPKYKLPPGFRKSLEIFNLDRAKKERGPLIVVEGFFDAMKVHQFGHRKVVALMGSSLSAAQEELIRRHISLNELILVMLGEDDAGRNARSDIAARLARFAFIRIQAFEEEGQEPEHLADEALRSILSDLPLG